MRRLVVFCAMLLTACDPKPDGTNLTNQSNRANGGAIVPPPPTIFDSSDAVLQLLQQRVKSRLGGSDDFQVQPIGAFAFPIGTLMPEGRTIGKNRTACAPNIQVGNYPMSNTFNSIAMKGKVAFELGLNEVLSELASAGLKVGQDDTFELSVKGAQGRFLLDDELEDVLKQESCKVYLSGKTMNLVRGYVIGQRSYLLERSRTGSGGAGLTNVGDFKVEGSRGTKVSLADENPIEFLLIVSKVSLPGAGSTATPSVAAPSAPPGPGRVYLQRDTLDSSDGVARVQKVLAGLSLEVVARVEAVESRKMPMRAQVRYFNKEDETLADRTANALKGVFSDATKIYVGLKAPPGQLEVWLPRVSR